MPLYLVIVQLLDLDLVVLKLLVKQVLHLINCLVQLVERLVDLCQLNTLLEDLFGQVHHLAQFHVFLLLRSHASGHNAGCRALLLAFLA